MTEPHGAAALRKFLDNTSSLHPKTKARLLADLSAAERDARNAAFEEAAKRAEIRTCGDQDTHEECDDPAGCEAYHELAQELRAMKETAT